MEESEKHTEFLLENLKGRHHLEDIGLDERIILKQIYDKQGVRK
jgi:hypothetical protein